MYPKISWSAFIYTRAYSVDYTTLVIPDNFREERKKWVMAHFRFDWLNYCGGLLFNDANKDNNNEDRKFIFERLRGSDCVFLCISAEYLTRGFTPKAALKAGIGMMNSFMTEVAAKVNPTPQNPFPVAIIVTKADLLTNYDSSLHKNADEIVKKFFENTLFVPGSPWLIGIIPVSLDKELAQNPDLGIVNHFGVQLPVTFGLLCKLIKQRNRLAQPSKGNWSWLSPILETNLNDKQATELNTQIEQLDRELASVPIYAGDRRIYSLLKYGNI